VTLRSATIVVCLDKVLWLVAAVTYLASGLARPQQVLRLVLAWSSRHRSRSTPYRLPFSP
jgi:hypothetical protein